MKNVQENQLKPSETQFQQSIKDNATQKISKRNFFLIIGIILLVLFTIIVTYFFHSSKTSTGTPPGPPEQQTQPTQAQSQNVSQLSSTCQPNYILVNPCRPWVGAAAHGNPGIPGQTPPGKDVVSQFQYLETLTGRPLDIIREYHSDPNTHNSISDPPLRSSEIYFANRPNTYVDVNWHPSSTWQQAMPVSQGGDPTVNANIDKVAASIKSIAPHKIFLSIWHEANDHISSGTGCSHFNTTEGYGNPSQFVAAWQNVYNHFKADGVTNVVWVLNYATYAPNTCWVTQLWPGNQYVDWVIYDTYSRGKTWDETSGVFYHFLEQNTTPAVNFASKPWGIGEFGTCKQPTTGITQDQYYQSVKAALDANSYPRLKMYLVFADTGNNSGPGCLTDYDPNGTYDPAKQTVFNQLINDSIFSK